VRKLVVCAVRVCRDAGKHACAGETLRVARTSFRPSTGLISIGRSDAPY